MHAAVIREATPEDLPAVASLLDAYFCEWNIWHRDNPDDLRAKLAAPLGCGLAEAGGVALGCVFGHLLPAVPAAAECKRLFVAPHARGHGLATMLMDWLEQRARDAGLEWMYLDTNDDFASAVAMYTKRGYLPCQRYNDNRQATKFFRKSLS